MVLKFRVCPVHNGPLLVGAGVAGNGFTTTVVVPGALVHVPTVTVTLYTPASVGSTFGIDGLRMAEVKPLGPVQL